MHGPMPARLGAGILLLYCYLCLLILCVSMISLRHRHQKLPLRARGNLKGPFTPLLL